MTWNGLQSPMSPPCPIWP